MIINEASVTSDMRRDSIGSSSDTLRKTKSGTSQVVMKYRGNKPRCFYGISTYTHSQILAIMNNTRGRWYRGR